jgi:hypothetical protein
LATAANITEKADVTGGWGSVSEVGNYVTVAVEGAGEGVVIVGADAIELGAGIAG